MSIFINTEETFLLKLRFVYKYNDLAQPIGVKIINDDAEFIENEQCLSCQVKGRDYDTMSRVLEKTTIINHISGKPMIRSRVFNKLIIVSFFISWDAVDDQDKTIEINNDNIGKMNYDLVKALSRKWLNLTGKGNKI
jgi:hypothetical protein